MNHLRNLSIGLASLSLLALAGCGGDSDSDSSDGTQEIVEAREVAITATEYQFLGDGDPNLIAGETIRFVVTNEGELTHEMLVLDGDGKLLASSPEIPPGETGEVTVTFETEGVYQAICDIDDHLTRGQQARFTVAAP